jgi:hypothetical protein
LNAVPETIRILSKMDFSSFVRGGSAADLLHACGIQLELPSFISASSLAASSAHAEEDELTSLLADSIAIRPSSLRGRNIVRREEGYVSFASRWAQPSFQFSPEFRAKIGVSVEHFYQLFDLCFSQPEQLDWTKRKRERQVDKFAATLVFLRGNPLQQSIGYDFHVCTFWLLWCWVLLLVHSAVYFSRFLSQRCILGCLILCLLSPRSCAIG